MSLLALLALAAAALAGALAGALAARRRAQADLISARAVWGELRFSQIGEFLSYILYQLREYQVSATSLVEAVALSAPKDDAALAERIQRLRRVILELDAKTSRLLGDRTPVTTRARAVQTVALGSFTREVARQAALAFGAPAVSLRLVVEKPEAEATCEITTLRASLLGALQNAFEACLARGGGSIAVTTRAGQDRGEIEIADDAGAAPERPEEFFEPFFSSRPGSSSLGLGLPMARRMMERLGGSIRLEAKGGGIATILELPLSRKLPLV
ncbi:MAG: sensor histidine kinase, partial [Elusimicrobia bacterium]|nr:sensor histidine kinase [Elusimicrobiota bacterium]